MLSKYDNAICSKTSRAKLVQFTDIRTLHDM